MSKLDAIIDIEFLKERDACIEGIVYFKKNIKEPIAARELIEVLLATDELEKIKWVNWLICNLFTREQKLSYAIFAAEQVLPIFEKRYPDDKLPRTAIEATKQVALNDTEENRKIAKEAAWAAGWAAHAATYAAYWAARAAANAANAAARAAANAYYAANAAADAAANAGYAANAAADAAARAAYAAARAASYAAGKEMLLKIINYGIGLLDKK